MKPAEHRAIQICILLFVLVLAFDQWLYYRRRPMQQVQAASAPEGLNVFDELQRINARDYPTCPWWIDPELWWTEDCPMGAAPGVPVPEGLQR